ncbi:DUF4232 domain-containing protein [Micrococcoides hystricis]|uniref:DUF4232 domain-containing protein n=1 Tax=Micrococcoides hystricis TaxID=1572761 RepID=A0ABV6PD75_9MICC
MTVQRKNRAKGVLIGLLLLATVFLLTQNFFFPQQEPSAEPTDETGQERLTYPGSDAAIPLSELSQKQINSIVQLSASGESAPNYCSPDQIQLNLGSFDAATGSRFTQLVATNVSTRGSALAPHPGLGVVGSDGLRLKVELEHTSIDINGKPTTPRTIVLEPNEQAWTDLMWTGALAGSEENHATALAVQFGPGMDAALFSPPGQDAGRHPNFPHYPRYDWGADPLHDLGSGTKLRLGQWNLATPPAKAKAA